MLNTNQSNDSNRRSTPEGDVTKMQFANLAAMEQSAKRASRLLKALSNEHRLLVLCRLTEGEKSVGELERLVGLSQSALSQHLARLRRDELVKTRRNAQTIYYSLSGDHATKVINVLYQIYCARQEDEDTNVVRVAESAD
jgi:DNA-binding transcriptional ArsR family regulator